MPTNDAGHADRKNRGALKVKDKAALFYSGKCDRKVVDTIRRAVTDAGFEPVTWDSDLRDLNAKPIISQVLELIRNPDCCRVIALLNEKTGGINSNVLYEFGYTHGFNAGSTRNDLPETRTVPVVDSVVTKDLPFDVRALRFVEYSSGGSPDWAVSEQELGKLYEALKPLLALTDNERHRKYQQHCRLYVANWAVDAGTTRKAGRRVVDAVFARVKKDFTDDTAGALLEVENQLTRIARSIKEVFQTLVDTGADAEFIEEFAAALITPFQRLEHDCTQPGYQRRLTRRIDSIAMCMVNRNQSQPVLVHCARNLLTLRRSIGSAAVKPQLQLLSDYFAGHYGHTSPHDYDEHRDNAFAQCLDTWADLTRQCADVGSAATRLAASVFAGQSSLILRASANEIRKAAESAQKCFDVVKELSKWKELPGEPEKGEMGKTATRVVVHVMARLSSSQPTDVGQCLVALRALCQHCRKVWHSQIADSKPEYRLKQAKLIRSRLQSLIKIVEHAEVGEFLHVVRKTESDIEQIATIFEVLEQLKGDGDGKQAIADPHVRERLRVALARAFDKVVKSSEEKNDEEFREECRSEIEQIRSTVFIHESFQRNPLIPAGTMAISAAVGLGVWMLISLALRIAVSNGWPSVTLPGGESVTAILGHNDYVIGFGDAPGDRTRICVMAVMLVAVGAGVARGQRSFPLRFFLCLAASIVVGTLLLATGADRDRVDFVRSGISVCVWFFLFACWPLGTDTSNTVRWNKLVSMAGMAFVGLTMTSAALMWGSYRIDLMNENITTPANPFSGDTASLIATSLIVLMRSLLCTLPLVCVAIWLDCPSRLGRFWSRFAMRQTTAGRKKELATR